MKAGAFDYARPRDLAEALKLLGEGGKAAAGTQSLGPMLNLRVLQPALLVDLRQIAELRDCSETRDSLTLGACVTHAQIEDGRLPDPAGAASRLLREVAANIAYRAVRNRGTVGGSLVHADPAADWPSALTLLGATAVIAGAGARREVPLEQFFTGLFETALREGELLVAVRIPKRPAAAQLGYWKFCRKAGEFAQAIGGALRDPERREARALIGATSGAPRLFADAKDLLARPDDAACLAAADAAGLGSDRYSRQLHAVALKRAIARAQASTS